MSRRRNNKKKMKAVVDEERIPRPPTFSADVVVSKVFRYQASTSSWSTGISTADLAVMLFMPTGTTLGTSLYSALKVNKIDIWSPPTVGSMPSLGETCGLQWTSAQGPSRMISATSFGATVGAHISSKPPAKSLASDWIYFNILGTTTNWFQMFGAGGEIIDVHVTFVLQNLIAGFGGATGTGGVYTGLTVGAIIASFLDQHSGTSSVLQPIGYATQKRSS